MYKIIKSSKNKLFLVKRKSKFSCKMSNKFRFYDLKIKIVSYSKLKKIIKDIYILGHYLLCFYRVFVKTIVLNSLKYCIGLKYFLTNYINLQKDLEKFIRYCKNSKKENSYLKYSYFDFKNNKNKFEFLSSQFNNLVYSIRA